MVGNVQTDFGKHLTMNYLTWDQFKRAPKYSRVVVILFNTGFNKSLFSAYSIM